MPMSSADFNYIQKVVKEKSAIVLETGKEYLVESRLVPLVRQQGLASIEELISKIKSPTSAPLLTRVVEAMTTNETSFFRDIHPFEALKKHLFPELFKKREALKELSIWSAASSTGQEAYTIALILREFFPQYATNWKIRIIGTDISQEILKRAREGKFNQIEINRGLPAALMVKYFEKQGMEWQLKEEVRKMVEFQFLNLAEQWGSLPGMDIVFLRNVLIYFDLETKRQILTKVYKLLKPDGYLFLGGAETPLNIHNDFEAVYLDKAICYRKK